MAKDVDKFTAAILAAATIGKTWSAEKCVRAYREMLVELGRPKGEGKPQESPAKAERKRTPRI